MESTLKIDYNGRGAHGVPVIKIIQPIEVTKSTCNESIDDVRDRLISEFLHTPQYVNRNHIFRTDSHFPHPIETPKVFITTISAVQEEEVLRFFKLALLDRFVEYESRCEINRIKSNNEQLVGTTKAPIHYDRYLKIIELFEYLSDLEYCNSFNAGY